MKNNRKLGKAQIKWLIALRDFGAWSQRACWWVGRPENCKKVCESLVKRKLAYREKVKDVTFYRLTSAGKKKAMALKDEQLVCTHASGQEPWRKDQ